MLKQGRSKAVPGGFDPTSRSADAAQDYRSQVHAVELLLDDLGFGYPVVVTGVLRHRIKELASDVIALQEVEKSELNQLQSENPWIEEV